MKNLVKEILMTKALPPWQRLFKEIPPYHDFCYQRERGTCELRHEGLTNREPV